MAVPFLRAPSHGSISAHAGASLEALQHVRRRSRARLVPRYFSHVDVVVVVVVVVGGTRGAQTVGDAGAARVRATR